MYKIESDQGQSEQENTEEISDNDNTNAVIGNGRSDKKIQRYNIVQLSQYRRTVIGILTEPLKGDLIKNQSNENEVIGSADEKVSYVPKSHV